MFTKLSLVAAMVVAMLGAGCGTMDGGSNPATDLGGAMLPDMLGLPQADLTVPPQGNDASQAMTEAQCLALWLAPASCSIDGLGTFPPPCKFPTTFMAGMCVAECWSSNGTEPTGLHFDAHLGMGSGSFSGETATPSHRHFTCAR